MRIKRLVSDLVDLGALGTGVFVIRAEPLRLREVLEERLAFHRPLAVSKQLSLELQLHSGLPPLIHADQARLCQVLDVLLDNALRLTSSGGVRVEARLGDPADFDCGRGTRLAGDFLEIHVADTGPAIPEVPHDRLHHIFRRLRGGHREGDAAMSLAVAARWCEAMGGALRVESDGESGTTFVVCLPLGLPASQGTALVPGLTPPVPA